MLLVCFLCKIFVWLLFLFQSEYASEREREEKEQKEREVKEKSDAVGEGVKRKRELKLSRRNERNEGQNVTQRRFLRIQYIYIPNIKLCACVLIRRLAITIYHSMHMIYVYVNFKKEKRRYLPFGE